jgi:hypothetical protein
MTTIRYVPGKIWMNFLFAVAGGVAIVVILNALWTRTTLPGGIGGLVAVVAMLLPGVIKRGSRTEPIVTIDGRGVTIELLGVGTIPWDRIRSARIVGKAWWTGQRLTIAYTGQPPKAGFWAKLNWGFHAKQNVEVATIAIGYINMTDQPKSTIETALGQLTTRAA